MHRKPSLALLAATASMMFCAVALAQSATAEGVVRKVDAANGRLIIKHGEFRGHDMAAMTMAFSVRDPALLEGLKAQDEIRFATVKDGRDWVVTAISRVSSTPVATRETR